MPYKKTVSFEIRTLNNIIRRQIIGSENIKYVNDLTGATSWVIGYLVNNSDKNIYQRDIEKEFSIRRSTVSKILTKMEERGLIVREPVSSDARLKKIVLTPKALELNKLVENDIVKIDERITQGLTNEEIDAFMETISKIKSNLI